MASEWTEHTTDKGRKYWHSKISNNSVWEKPEELKTPHERAISKTPWKEYEYEGDDGSKDGRKYYVHSETKETTWEVPEEVTSALKELEGDEKSDSQPEKEKQGIQIGPIIPIQEEQKEVATQADSSTPLPAPPASLPSRPNTVTPAPTVNTPPVPLVPVQVEFDTPEQARQAFQNLLRESGVTPSWTWEQTMHTIVTHPVYKALKTLAERKSAFEEYINQVKAKEKEHKEKNMERLRPTWREALGRACGRENGMKLWWSWPRSMRYLIANEPEVWKSAKEDEERENLWRDFVRDMRRKEDIQNRELKERNEAKLVKLLSSLNLEIDEPWRDVRKLVMSEPAWKQDSELQRIEMMDFLVIFERIVKDKETSVIDVKNKKRKEKRRKQRKIREEFKELLQELKDSGKIKSSTKWSEIYPQIREDKRYIDMLSNVGSSPLDLFWDVVDEEYLKIDEHTRAIVNLLSIKDWRVQENTRFEEFMDILKLCLTRDVTTMQDGDEDVKEASQSSWKEKVETLSDASLHEAFDLIHSRAVNVAKEERKRREKKYRAEIDDLRYVLRKLDPPISVDATFEDVIPRIEGTFEYKALDDDSMRRTAFDKFIRRLKEKMREEHSDNESVGSKRRSRHETPQAERKRHKSARYSASPQWGHERGLDYDGMEVDEERRRPSRRSRHDDEYEADRRERRGRRTRDRERDRDREKDRDRARDRERDREKDADRRERRRERKSQSPRKEAKEEREKERKVESRRNDDSELEEGEI